MKPKSTIHNLPFKIMAYSTKEKEVLTITAQGKDCIGCQKHQKDIMISYTSKGEDQIIDLFLTEYQARTLLENLNKLFAERKLEIGGKTYTINMDDFAKMFK